MQAVILAAGRGGRLREGIPKCLIRLGDRSLLEHQIQLLRSLGIKDICAVIGYGADQVRSVVGDQCHYVLNPRPLETNSLYSLSLTRDWVRGAFIQVNCDVVADPRVYRRVLGSRCSTLAYDSRSGNSDEHMKVSIHRQHLCQISKALPSSACNGESLGILKYDDEGARALFAAVEQVLADDGEMCWAPAAVARLVQTHKVRCVDVAGLPWTEIDYVEDALYAKFEIWPALRAQNRARGWSGPARRARQVAAQVVSAMGTFGGVFQDLF
ncbi:phosphocholine cytidylyltransferase family protein [soil metagenome]